MTKVLWATDLLFDVKGIDARLLFNEWVYKVINEKPDMLLISGDILFIYLSKKKERDYDDIDEIVSGTSKNSCI